MPRPLRILLAVNLVAALAAGVVLFLWPGAIPATVGLDLAPQDAFVARLLGAAEFATAALSGLALRTPSDEARRLAVATLIVLHVASVLALVLALGGTTAPGLVVNLVARLVQVALLWRFGLARRAA